MTIIVIGILALGLVAGVVATNKGVSMLKVIYTFFMGLLLAVFVGVGIAAFYTAPKYPDCWQKAFSTPSGSDATKTDPTLESANAECQKQQDAYEAARQTYSRNVSVMALGSAVLFLIVGLSLAKSLGVLADGFVLGGLFALVYSVGVGFESEDFKYRFLVVSIGVVVALALGYFKFVRPPSDKKHQ